MNIKSLLLFSIILFFCSAIKISAQNSAGVFLSSSYSLIKPFNLRMSADLSFGSEFEFEDAAITTFVDPDTKRLYISSNFLTLICNQLDAWLCQDHKFSFLILNPMFLSNLRINFHIMSLKPEFFIKEKTDFFLFYEPAKVHTETMLGVEYYFNKVSIWCSVNLPWTDISMLDSKQLNPYFSIGLRINYKEGKGLYGK